MIGKIERYLYSWSFTDRIRNNKLHKQLAVASFTQVTARYKNIPDKDIVNFYEQSLEILFHHRIDPTVKTMIAYAIYQFYNHSAIDPNEWKTIRRYIKNIPAKECPLPNWKALCTFFMCNGCFHLSFIARKKYKEKLLATRGRIYRWSRAQAYLEESNIELAQKEINKIEHSIGMRSAYNIGIPAAKRFIDLISKQKKQIKSSRPLRKGDKHFYDYLSGKKIIIEGPAPEIQLPDISRNTCFVRSDYFLDWDNKITDITYLNYESFKLYSKHCEKYQNSWKYTCFKKVDDDFQLKAHTRMAWNPNGIFLIGNPNMLPLMLFDLAGEDIYVTGNNLYLSSVYYSKKNTKKTTKKIQEEESAYNSIELCGFMGDHDAITQHLFLQKLFKAGLFEADQQLTYVLNLSAEQYCIKMDRLHGIAHYVQPSP